MNFYFVGLTHFNVGYTHLILIEEIKKENIQIDIYFAVQIFLEHMWSNKKMSQYFVFHKGGFKSEDTGKSLGLQYEYSKSLS